MKLEFPVNQITEGSTKLLTPDQKNYEIPEDAPVFYNPEMELSRDLSVAYLEAKEIKNIIDPLAATGARGIRYINETSVKNGIINDINPKATELIKRNIDLNNLNQKISVKNKDANEILNKDRSYDLIDLDPFGSPMNFIDSALRLRPRLLAITATDTAPLCGAHVKSCIRKYNSKPIRANFCHEIGLRILIGQIARYAAKYDIGVEVDFSHSSKHFFRAYLELETGAKRADKSIDNLGYVYYCPDCLHREFEKDFLPKNRNCENCDSLTEIAGPLWLGGIKNESLISKMLKISENKELNSGKKVKKLLKTIKNEIDEYGYYDIHKIAKKQSIRIPKTKQIKKRLETQDLEVSDTHFNSTSIKTKANINEIVKVMKELNKERS